MTSSILPNPAGKGRPTSPDHAHEVNNETTEENPEQQRRTEGDSGPALPGSSSARSSLDGHGANGERIDSGDGPLMTVVVSPVTESTGEQKQKISEHLASSGPKRSPKSNAKKVRSLVSNVVYDSRLLTGEQKKSKSDKQRTSPTAPLPLLTGEQPEDLKPILPDLQAGFWWDAPANGKGYKINLRWRDEQKKQRCHSFRRLGKYELETLRKGTNAEQRADITDWLIGELNRAGRSDLTARIKIDTQNDSGFGRINSASARL